MVKLNHITSDAEKLIASIARVSNPSNQNNHATAPRLIRYCIKHQHWSPFEMASMCLEIQTTRAISAQIIRHRSFSFQEFSQRYAKLNTDGWTMPEMRLSGSTNRQSSLPIDDDAIRSKANSYVYKAMKEAMYAYEKLIELGIANETARSILPMCSPTVIFMHGTIRSWIHYIQLRDTEDTQLEHRIIAEGAKRIFVEQLPLVSEALEWL